MKKEKLLNALLVCAFAASSAQAESYLTVPDKTSNVTVDYSVSDHSALNGGAINNYVGGTVTVKDYQSFTNNTATAQNQGGGAIYSHNQGTVNIGNSVTFTNNYLNNDSSLGAGNESAGGAISAWESSNLTIGTGSVFYNNGYNSIIKEAALATGGAIYIDTDGQTQNKMTIGSGAKFTGNVATKAGAVYIGGTDAQINGATFDSNEATNSSGGAIYTFGGQVVAGGPDVKTSLTLGESNFTGNKAKYDGGAIYNYASSSVNVAENSIFDGNKALEGNGGAISNNGYFYKDGDVTENYKASVTANNVTFQNNSAKNGGAVYNSVAAPYTVDKMTSEDKGLYSDVKVSGTFTKNSATQNGGAIYNDGKMTVGKSTFSGNSAAQGGAIYNTVAGTIAMNDVTVDSALVDSELGELANDIHNEGAIVTQGENTFASKFTNNGTLELNGKNTLSGKLVGNGSINNKGEITLTGDSSGFSGEYTTSTNSITTVTDKFFSGNREFKAGTLNWRTKNANALSGTLKVSGNDTKLNIDETLTLVEGSSIAESVQTSLNEGGVLNIKGGSATLDSATNDIWNGDINLSSGDLTVSGLSNNGKLNATGGDLTLDSVDLTIGQGSQITESVKLETTGSTSINVIGNVDENGDAIRGESGYVHLGNDDSISSTTNIVLDGGTLDYAINTDASALVDAKKGNLNLLEGSTLKFNGGTVADIVNLNIGDGAALSLENTTLYLDRGDAWNGQIVNEGGTINADNLIKSSSTASLKQADGTLNLYNNTDLKLGEESSISGGNINIQKDKIDGSEGTAGSTLTTKGNVITGGDMTIDEYSKFVVASGSFKLDSLTASADADAVNVALINTMNGERNSSSIETLTVNNQANFNIDVHARSNLNRSNDQFEIGTLAGDGKTYIQDWALNGDIYGWDAPIDRIINLDNIFVDKNGNAIINTGIEITDKETFTPIGWYYLKKNEEYEQIRDESTGLITRGPLIGTNYSLNLSRFNPQVFRGQVATVAQWMNQLAIDDMLFTHSMVLPSFKEENGKMANNYASINPLFSPYQYSIKDGGLWYKMYGTFEHLQMNQGMKVGNNSYGALVGADFGRKDLKNGWKFMPTAYVGYNGAHQYWAGMGQYQNGGQAGLMGTWYKDNFIVGGLVYGGVYENSMDVHGTTDNTFNYFAGAATKASYNIRLHRDWVLQPNLMAAYNYFGQQNWHSDFGQMGMMAGMLHGVNIAPGVNLIWEKETFSAYATLQYMYNINGACGGRAGNVGLPNVQMDRGYIQYGLGFTKKFADRFSGYLQAVLRNVGRTGVGFQAGFNIYLGK